MTSQEFSPKAHQRLLLEFRSAGYRCICFQDLAGERRELLLRHDIDLSLECARPRSELASSVDVAGTFFFLVSGLLYNLAPRAGRAAVAHSCETGNRIGRHSDASVYGSATNLEDATRVELEFLRTLSPAGVDAIIFHRPSLALQRLEGSFTRAPHTYGPCLFGQMEYCSDSRSAFHHGLPTDRESFACLRPFQLSTHPIWWASFDSATPLDWPVRFVEDHEQRVESDLSENSEPIRDHLSRPGT